MIALPFGQITLFPVDMRFGWNIAPPSHQRMLLKVDHECKPLVSSFEPRCKSWSRASFTRDPAKTDAARKAELPMLRFLGKHMIDIEQDG